MPAPGVGSKAATMRAPAYGTNGRSILRRPMGALRRERQTRTKRVAVVLSLFLVLLAGGLLVGGRTVIDPLLQAAADRREAHRMGDIVFTMRDGTICRHLSFDNKTAEITEGAVEPCAPDVSAEHAAQVKNFTWGTR